MLIFSLFGNSFFNALVTTLSTMLVLKIFGTGHELVLSLSTLLVTLMIIIFQRLHLKLLHLKRLLLVLRAVAIPLYFCLLLLNHLFGLLIK